MIDVNRIAEVGSIIINKKAKAMILIEFLKVFLHVVGGIFAISLSLLC